MALDAASRLAGAAGPQTVAAAIKRAGEAAGVDFSLLYNMARRESSLDPNATAKTSSAAGLYQFIDQTWLATVKKYGAKHGLAAEADAIGQNSAGRYSVADPAMQQRILNLRFDPFKAAGLAAELVNENKAGLERRLGRAVGAAEVYAAHFLGVGGAAKLLSAPANTAAADLLPEAAKANRPVFYDGARARTTGEVMASIAQSMNTQSMNTQPGRAAETPRAAAAPASINETALRAVAAAPAEKTAPPPPMAPERKGFDYAGLPPALARAGALSPLAIAVLQALDPTRIGADRDGFRALR